MRPPTPAAFYSRLLCLALAYALLSPPATCAASAAGTAATRSKRNAALRSSSSAQQGAPPAANLPNLDDIRELQPTEPEAPPPVPSTLCAPANPNCPTGSASSLLPSADQDGHTTAFTPGPETRRVSADRGRVPFFGSVFDVGVAPLWEFTLALFSRGSRSNEGERPAPASEAPAASTATLMVQAAPTNLAAGKTATQSSTGWGGDPARAVDGNTDGNYNAGSVTHTALDAQARWEVDLGGVHHVQTVEVWNRTDCCADRLTDFYVLVSDSPIPTALANAVNDSRVSSYHTTGQGSRPTPIAVNRTGRYVRVQLAGTNYLSLAEVQVWGSGPVTRSLAVGGAGLFRVPHSAGLNPGGPFTLEAWFKPNATAGVQHLVSRYTSTGEYYLIANGGMPQLYAVNGSGQSDQAIAWPPVITANEWHHIAGVFDGTQLRVYLDGILRASKNTTVAPGSGTGELTLGGFHTGSWAMFSGLIDEVRLTEGALYTSDFTPQARLSAVAGTRGLWKFDGQVGADSSGNGNHGATWGDVSYSADVPVDNLLPSVSLTGPADSSTFPNDTNVTLTAEASDADGSVTKVEFFDGGTKLGEDTSAPYSLALVSVPAGTHSLTARATDDRGAQTMSAAVSVTALDFTDARLDPNNRTGSNDAYSRNFNWGVTLVSLPGRAALDLELTLSYNSLIWTKSASAALFDGDRGFPTPGFRFGLPVIQGRYTRTLNGSNVGVYVLISQSGERVELRRQGASNVYEAADASRLRLEDNGGALLLRPPDGSLLSFSYIGGEYQCTEIKDRNGNYLTAGYTGFGRLASVTDTLGRVVTVNYDANQNPVSITQPWTRELDDGTADARTHTWATFGYETRTLEPSFGGLSLAGAQHGSAVNVLSHVGLDDGSYYKFSYTPFGQVYKVTHYAADSVVNGVMTDSHPLSHTRLNLPGSDLLGVTEQSDCPRFTERREWAEYGIYDAKQSQETVTTYSAWSPDSASCEVTLPDRQTVHREEYAPPVDGWKRGLVTRSEVKVGGVVKKWTSLTWEHDGGAGDAHPTNPRVTQTVTGDDQPANTRTTRVEYTPAAEFSLPRKVEECGADCNTVIRTTVTTYDIPNLGEYSARRIIGLPHFVQLYEGAPVVPNLRSKVGYVYDEPNTAEETFLEALASAATAHDAANYGAGLRWRAHLNRVRRYEVGQQDGTESGEYTETRVGYNVTGSAVFTKDAANHKTSVGYDDSFYADVNRSNPRLQTYAYPTSEAVHETVPSAVAVKTSKQYNYDLGAVIKVTLPKGNITHFEAGPQTKTFFDAAGRLRKVLSLATNTHTEWSYDPATNAVNTFSTEIDDSVSDAGLRAHSITLFTGDGRVRGEAKDLPAAGQPGRYAGTRVQYDVMGRVEYRSNPTEMTATGANWTPAGDDHNGGQWRWTRQQYDWKGRPTVTTNPDGTTTEASYDGCGCGGGEVMTASGETVLLPPVGVSGAYSPGRRQAKVYRDLFGRVYKREVLNGDGSVYMTTVTEFNARDQATSVREYKGPAAADGSCPTGTCQSTTTTYDGYGRVQSRRAPEQTAPVTFTYNPDDTVWQEVDPRGATQTYTYNDRHLLTGVTFDAPFGVDAAASLAFSYDAAGNRKTQSDKAGTVDYVYNDLSRLISETRRFAALNHAPYTLGYDYNLAGLLTGLTDHDSRRVAYEYHWTGDLKRVSDASAVYASGMYYRAWGALKEMGHGNGLKTEMAYDVRQRVTSYRVAPSGSQPGTDDRARSEYEYEGDGRVKQTTDYTDGGFNRFYLYDHVGRLIDFRTSSPASFQTFGYDQFNHLTTRGNGSWRYHDTTHGQYVNNRNTRPSIVRPGSAEQVTPWTYDADGNVTRDHNKEYTFNAAGDRSRVLETTSLGIALTQKLWIYQDYDADGKRVVRATQKQINLGPYEIVTNYYVRSSVLDGEVVAELHSNGLTKQTFVHANGTVVADKAQVWVHADPVTNSLRTTGPDGGLATRGELDPMGNDIAVTDPAPPDEPTPDYIYPGNYDQNGNHYDGASGCSLDGQPVPCSIVLRFVSVGAAGVCADNRCRPGQRLTDDGWDFWDEGPAGMVHVKGLIDLRTGRVTDWWRPGERQRRPRRTGTQRPQRQPQNSRRGGPKDPRSLFNDFIARNPNCATTVQAAGSALGLGNYLQTPWSITDTLPVYDTPGIIPEQEGNLSVPRNFFEIKQKGQVTAVTLVRRVGNQIERGGTFLGELYHYTYRLNMSNRPGAPLFIRIPRSDRDKQVTLFDESLHNYFGQDHQEIADHLGVEGSDPAKALGDWARRGCR